MGISGFVATKLKVIDRAVCAGFANFVCNFTFFYITNTVICQVFNAMLPAYILSRVASSVDDIKSLVLISSVMFG